MASSQHSQSCKLNFSKYVGAGNDFILFDDRALTFPCHNKDLIKRLCHRQFGIGADGIILLQLSSRADFRFRIFNADSSEAEMCGNGVRCFGKFVSDLGFNLSTFSLETTERILKVEMNNDDIVVEMGEPREICFNIEIDLHKKKEILHYMDTGVPHAVLFVKDLDKINVFSLGKEIRFHLHFQPKGANANFAMLQGDTVHLRTYERGVEEETLACGTGATATALVAAKIYGLPSPVKVRTMSGETLKISFKQNNDSFEDVAMSGSAKLVFQGVITVAKKGIL